MPFGASESERCRSMRHTDEVASCQTEEVDSWSMASEPELSKAMRHTEELESVVSESERCQAMRHTEEMESWTRRSLSKMLFRDCAHLWLQFLTTHKNLKILWSPGTRVWSKDKHYQITKYVGSKCIGKCGCCKARKAMSHTKDIGHGGACEQCQTAWRLSIVSRSMCDAVVESGVYQPVWFKPGSIDKRAERAGVKSKSEGGGYEPQKVLNCKTQFGFCATGSEPQNEQAPLSSSRGSESSGSWQQVGGGSSSSGNGYEPQSVPVAWGTFGASNGYVRPPPRLQ